MPHIASDYAVAEALVDAKGRTLVPAFVDLAAAVRAYREGGEKV